MGRRRQGESTGRAHFALTQDRMAGWMWYGREGYTGTKDDSVLLGLLTFEIQLTGHIHDAHEPERLEHTGWHMACDAPHDDMP